MLVVISDLHFEEENTYRIYGEDSNDKVLPPRNINPQAFSKIIDRLAAQARRDNAKKLDLVLAGDIFELHRTGLWFENNPEQIRPYDMSTEAFPFLEAKTIEILDAISNKGGIVAETLSILRRLKQEGTYQYDTDSTQTFPVPVEIHYIPGNHDRLTNLSAKTRQGVRDMLGMQSSDAPFDHVMLFENERAVIRHGHEYDPLNFTLDLTEEQVIPTNIDPKVYSASPIGDFITTEIVAHLPFQFRVHHGDQTIMNDPLLRTIYRRSLEFDDLRPIHALFNYLVFIPGAIYSPKDIWENALRPVIARILDAIHDHPFLHRWLDKMDRRFVPDLADAIQAILSLKPWKWTRLSLAQIQILSDVALGYYGKHGQPARHAAREEAIVDGEYLFMVCGHSHVPAVELIGQRQCGEQYYVDTGTWRRRIPATPDYRSFGRIKTLTYAVLYGPDEDKGTSDGQGMTASLDYWSGVTERWVRTC